MQADLIKETTAALATLKEKNAELNAQLMKIQAAQEALKTKQKSAHSAKTAKLKTEIATLTASNKKLKKELSKIELDETAKLKKIREQIAFLTKSTASLEEQQRELKQKPTEQPLKQKPAEQDPQAQLESLKRQKAACEAELATKRARLTQIADAIKTKEAERLQAAEKAQIKKKKTEKIQHLTQEVEKLKLENTRLNTARLPDERRLVQLEISKRGGQFEKAFQREKLEKEETGFRIGLEQLPRVQQAFLSPPPNPQYPIYAPPPVMVQQPDQYYPYLPPSPLMTYPAAPAPDPLDPLVNYRRHPKHPMGTSR